ncbi:MAG: hypothetical protein LBI47_01825 [Puniceicoccales bacterium]|nr:hypothetical protein [Puniceicoccales bacterium]
MLMKRKKLMPRDLLVCLIFCLFPMVAGCTQTSGTLGGAAIGTGADAGIGYAIGGKGGVLGSEVAAQKKQASAIKTFHGPSSEGPAAHTSDGALELEKQKLEVGRQRIELEKEKQDAEFVPLGN